MTAAELRRIGPYLVDGRLGRGGMGVVYRARHEGTGHTVALKTVEVPDASLLHGIRREIQALSRLAHPGIVRILDQGLDGGVPWYAMELLRGVTLQALVPGDAPPSRSAGERDGRWWTGYMGDVRETERLLPRPAAAGSATRAARTSPLPPAAGGRLPWVLTVTRRLCAPLAYLHGEGLVHRDLKPANVLVKDGETPVLLDFGLMARFGGEAARESLELDADAVGTVAYVAPEQGQGEMVDARADLYALGCMLYELLAGEPPFTGPSAADVLARRYRGDPDPPSTRVTGIPAALDELVMRLLARDPRERLGHADDVAAALGRLGAEDALAAGPRPRPYLYRPGIAGRAAEVEALGEHLERLYEGKGALVLLGGESGVGKTRLAMEVASRAYAQRLDVLLGECPPPAGGGEVREPLAGLKLPLRVVADRCRERDAAYTEAVLGQGAHRGALLGRYVPAIADLPAVKACPEPSDLGADAARARLFTYLGATLEALGRERPLLLVLDDVQWADDLSSGLLRFLVDGGHLAAMPVLVLATYRRDEVDAPLERLRGAAAVVDVVLERLPSAVVGEMVADMLALPRPPAPLVSFLSEVSEGNPFFVAEYLRTAVAEGILARDGEGRWRVAGEDVPGAASWDIPLPRHVQDLVGRRLAGLGASARSLAEALSVLGREADLDVVVASEGMDETAGMDALNELRARQVVDEVSPGRLRFLHDKLREACHGGLPEAERVRRHAAAARVLEALPATRRDEHLSALGHHHERAGDVARARACYLPAARRELARHALDEAERLYRAYLALAPPSSGDAIDARNELGGRVLGRLGKQDLAIAEHRQALAASRDAGDAPREAETLRLLGIAHANAARTGDAMAFHREALDLARRLEDRRLQGLVLNNMGSVTIAMGRPEEARGFLAQALALQRETGDRAKEALTLGNLAITYNHQGRAEEGRGLLEQALAIHRELRARPEEGQVLSNLASLHTDAGRFDEAERLYEEALRIHREDGNVRFQAFVLANLASLHADAGRHDRSLDHYRQASGMARYLGDLRFEAMLDCNLASMLYEQGRFAEARQTSARALGLARQLSERRLEGAALCNLALCDGRLGDAAGARRTYDEALAAARRAGDGHLEGQIHANRASLELGAGDLPAARRRLLKALPRLRDAGDRRLEVNALGVLASVERRAGRLRAAAGRLARARAVVEAGDLPSQLKLRCEEGHLALARGRDGRVELTAAEALAARLKVAAGSGMGEDAEELRQAVEAAERGAPLRHGELPDRR